MKKIYKIIRKFVISVLLLYGFNIIMSPLNIIIPINYVTIPIIMILGNFSIMGFVSLLIFVY